MLLLTPTALTCLFRSSMLSSYSECNECNLQNIYLIIKLYLRYIYIFPILSEVIKYQIGNIKT